MKETWENEPLHGQYLQQIQQADVDQASIHRLRMWVSES